MVQNFSPNYVLDFWFLDRVSQLWFNSNPAFDQELRERFEPVFKLASEGHLDHWQQTPEGCLALVIVLDQFPLNMYRGKAESYSTGDRAVAVAKAAVALGFDKQIPKNHLSFLYMPLLHSETLADQDLSVKLFENAGLNENISFAKHHREIVRKFGRFPHRNAALGRESTPEEKAYLSSKEAFLG